MDLLERVEALRIPAQPESVAADWKDWYHFVLLHPASGWRAIVNLNLSGGGERAELQATLVVHAAGETMRTHGASFAVPWTGGMVQAHPLLIQADEVALRFEQQAFSVRVAPRGLDVGLTFQARPDATPLLVTEGSPFGSGFIGWGVMPRLLAHGELWACGAACAIDGGWYVYQDHNFGRFRWGDDFGWEWMVAHVQPPDGPAVTVVVDLRTDRSHQRGGLPYLFVVAGHRLRKVFLGPAMRLAWHWSDAPSLPPRLPGALATLLGDRTVRRPVGASLHAADERDRITLHLSVDADLEVVAADNCSPAFTRISEVTGVVKLSLCLDGQVIEASGLAYAEYTR